MSRFMMFVRKYILRKDTGQKNSSPDNGDGDEHHVPNQFQNVVKAPRPYDEVVVANSGPKVDKPANNVNSPQKRAPRTYEEVELPAPNSDQKVELKS